MININENIILKIGQKYKYILIKERYPNPDKLEAIYIFWLSNLLLISQSGKLPASKILNNYLWFLNSCGLDLHKKKRKQKKNIKRKIINLIPFHKFSGYGILPGGQKKNTSFYDTLLLLSTYHTLNKTKIKINHDLRKDFFMSISSIVDSTSHQTLMNLTPDFFFSEIIRSNLPLKYRGSMTIAFEEPYNRIFFQYPPPHITAYTHGGFYGEYLKNKFETLEKKLCDVYLGWGLEDRNVLQNRFTNKTPLNKEIDALFLVGSAPVNILTKSYFSGLDEITSDADFFLKNYLFKKIKIDYLSHPSKSNKKKYFDNLKDSELDNSLFIIDRPGHTILYKCIYEGLPFALIYNDSWKVFFKPRFVKFLEFLEENKLLYWYSHKESFIENLIEYKNGKIFNKNKFILARKFLEENQYGNKYNL